MALYNVHVYREMRLFFPGIEAASPEEAARIAADRPTEDAEYSKDCEGENLAALIDVAGDDEFEHSVMLDFEAERLRKAAPELLAILEAVLPYAEAEGASLDECWKRDGDPRVKQESDACERALDQARTAIAKAQANQAGRGPA